MRARSAGRGWVAGTVALGSGAVVAALFQRADAPLATLALLGAAVVVTELIQVPSDESSPDPGDVHSLSFSSSIHIAAALLIGPWTAALVAAFGVVVADRLRGAAWRHVAYNASVFALAALAGGFAFKLVHGTPGVLELPRDLPAIAALGFAYYVANNAFMAAIVALETTTPFWPLARDASRDGFPTAAGELAVGVAVAVFAVNEPWGVVVLAPLVLAMYRSYERLATLRRETARALEAFANVVDERDPSTFQHSERVANYVRELGEALGLPAADVGRLRWAGRLHDLGKIAVDAAVLRKDSRLDDEEWATMRRHPRLSARLLRRFRLAANEARAVEFHHERFDGRGYYGINPSEIPLAAHLLVVADSYDAMRSDRAYRPGLSVEQALAEIEAESGSQFHPVVAKAFVALQRGLDPVAALNAEERDEMRRLLRAKPGRSRRLGTHVRPETVAAAALVLALALVGLGAPLLAAPTLVVGGAALAVGHLERGRVRRVATAVRRTVASAATRETAFAAIPPALAAVCEVRWAGLLSWHERECTGSLELDWSGGGDPPTETALTSWVLREVEAASGLLQAHGSELGRPETYVAVPLRRDETLAGYLVVAVRGRERTLTDALSQCAEELGHALAPPVSEDLPVRRLEAVAS